MNIKNKQVDEILTISAASPALDSALEVCCGSSPKSATLLHLCLHNRVTCIEWKHCLLNVNVDLEHVNCSRGENEEEVENATTMAEKHECNYGA